MLNEEGIEVWETLNVNKTVERLKSLGEMIMKHLVQPRNRAAMGNENSK